jgi:DNA-binding NarL/FixJ family response regulator
MPSPATSVAIADRHPAILSALKRILEPEFEVVVMADNLISLMDALRVQRPGAIVIDQSLCDEGGHHFKRHVARVQGNTPIVLIGDDPLDEVDDERPMTGQRFVPKSRTAELLCSAVAAAILETNQAAGNQC